MLKIRLRRPAKYRIYFLILMIIVYWLGFNLLPEQLTQTSEQLSLALVSALYFVLLPLLYWYWIIKIGAQKNWRILVILSLSSLMARLSYPPQIAEYFEFVAWLRFPIIAILLLIELYLMVSIIKGLWQARKASGDPRLAIIAQYAETVEQEKGDEANELRTLNIKGAANTDFPKNQMLDDKKLTLGLILATEPASWYYAIPYFSRRHPLSITQLKLLSAQPWHVLVIIICLIAASIVSYTLVDNVSHIAAVFVSGLILYSVVLIAANYRISRYYSLYQREGKLIINNGLWGFMSIDLTQISELKLGTFWAHVQPQQMWGKSVGDSTAINAPEILTIGRGDTANVQLIFKRPQTYYGGMGQLPEPLSVVNIVVDDPQVFADALGYIHNLQKAS
ncbi:hypothetical protein L5M43_04695 [Shewanella sp. SW36]|uniref:hypothetical protein n=1 Tax=unclassified Shewanella TaxID=196818 RepID=UPI0021D96590|nr:MULTISPECIES: hypothetical protein [unclassified Shewanella]MCU7974572.1 hypothetical protein [Shewanella sp. SW36]MCU7989960.1 hypothetical protein [Shewanella sp. SW1]MCU8051357.1 hypothetical protein [Shewanella sp. SM43]